LTNQGLENEENIDIAHEYYRAGKFKEEIKHYEEKLANAQDKKDEAHWLLMSGDAHWSSGKFQRANEYYKKALSVYNQIQNKEGEARSYIGIGNVYHRTGNLEKAIESHMKALHIARHYGYIEIESNSYLSLGFDYDQLGKFEQAIEYYFTALKIIENGIKIDVQRDEQKMACYGNIGIAYSHRRIYSRALHFHNEALKIAKKLGNRHEESACYEDLGNTCHGQGKICEAIDFYYKAFVIDNETDDINSQRLSSANLGLIYYEINRLQEAYHYLKRSIDLTELTAITLIQEDYKIGFYGRTHDAYRLMINTCLQLGCKEEAFAYAERGKSRALISMLAASKLTPSPINMSNELEFLIAKEEKILQRIREIQKRHLKPEESLQLNQDSDSLLKELETIYSKIKEVDPEYVSMRNGKPLDLNKIQSILSHE
jgi:tetratricopeptide (TPR) repeat protein